MSITPQPDGTAVAVLKRKVHRPCSPGPSVMPEFDRYISDCKFILVSNREPYEHVRSAGGVEVRQPAGGLVSALDPTMQRIHGTWVAWGSGSADRETADGAGRVLVPPTAQSYALRRVWLDDDEIEGYYHGFANRALWPLCHLLIQHFEYRAGFWEHYRAVNLRFAHAVADEAERCDGRSVIWIHDYHFALVAEFVRAMRPSAFIHQFWHIPFPPPDMLRLLPPAVSEAVLRGLLGNDLVEFQTDRHVENFLDCVEQLIPDAQVVSAEGRVSLRGRSVQVGAFPISIDVEHYEAMAQDSATEARVETLRGRYATNGRQLGVAVDRIDYTKGIPERLRALDHLWSTYPSTRGRVTFLFVCTPSRTTVPAYAALEREMTSAVLDINAKYETEDWTPIVVVHNNVDAELLAAVYRAADVCLVSSLQDGMNLVAKEFVACQVDERGVLVLSRFTGAAEDIDGAVLINPFNLDGFAAGIKTAIELGRAERRRRIRRMRSQLRDATIFDWLEGILKKAADIMEEQAREPAG